MTEETYETSASLSEYDTPDLREFQKFEIGSILKIEWIEVMV